MFSLKSYHRGDSDGCTKHIICSHIMAHLDEYQLLSDRPHVFRKRHSCETQLTTVINDLVKILDKGGQVDTVILDFEKAFGTPLINFLKANYLVMALAERHTGVQITFFAILHNELLLTVKLRSGLQICQVSHKGPLLVHYCSPCINDISTDRLRNKTFRRLLCLLS